VLIDHPPGQHLGDQRHALVRQVDRHHVVVTNMVGSSAVIGSPPDDAAGSAKCHARRMTGPVPEEDPNPRDVVANEETSDETEMADAQEQQPEPDSS
jgi:hypothetical protein